MRFRLSTGIGPFRVSSGRRRSSKSHRPASRAGSIASAGSLDLAKEIRGFESRHPGEMEWIVARTLEVGPEQAVEEWSNGMAAPPAPTKTYDLLDDAERAAWWEEG